jgi:hypothetical protein
VSPGDYVVSGESADENPTERIERRSRIACPNASIAGPAGFDGTIQRLLRATHMSIFVVICHQKGAAQAAAPSAGPQVS